MADLSAAPRRDVKGCNESFGAGDAAPAMRPAAAQDGRIVLDVGPAGDHRLRLNPAITQEQASCLLTRARGFGLINGGAAAGLLGVGAYALTGGCLGPGITAMGLGAATYGVSAYVSLKAPLPDGAEEPFEVVIHGAQGPQEA